MQPENPVYLSSMSSCRLCVVVLGGARWTQPVGQLMPGHGSKRIRSFSINSNALTAGPGMGTAPDNQRRTVLGLMCRA